MLPGTSKNSRRSSILKLPKRTNSQNAESNSSEENSPTKLKRRVSFAEKKSVKEFADSIEQGTVWDSTYEESDSSQIRMSQSEYIKSVVTQTSHLTFQSHQNLQSLSLRPEIEFKFPTETPRLSHVDPEILANKENMPEILGLGTVESSLVELEDVPVPTSGFSVYCDEDLNETNTEDVPMECTIVADALVPVGTQVPVPTSKATEEQNRTLIFGNESIEFTEAVPPNPLVCEKSMELTEAISSNLFRPAEKTELFHDKSMEFTEAVPSAKFLPYKFDKTVLHNNSMELTEAVPSLKFLNCDDRTQFFHNKTLELTGTVSRSVLPALEPPVDKTENFNNKSMEFTEAIPSCLKVFSSRNEEETQVFHNKSMELTEAIRRVPDDRTEVFHNKSMELTEAIGPEMNFLRKIPNDRTEVFHNNSMELTEAICPQLNFLRRVPEDRTEVFHNKSMELTEAIDPQVNFLRKVPDDKTEVFQNKSMELTEVIVPGLKLTCDKSLKLSGDHQRFDIYPENNSNDEKTQLFHNKSMELTGVVSLVPQRSKVLNTPLELLETMRLLESQTNRPVPVPEEQTQFFSNKSMEITEAICPQDRQELEIERNYFMENTVSINPSLKRSYKCIADPKTPKSAVSSPNPKNPRDSQVDRKASMDLLHRILLQNLDDLSPGLPESSQGDRVQDESMEMTVAIPSIKALEPQVPEEKVVELEVPGVKFVEPEVHDIKIVEVPDLKEVEPEIPGTQVVELEVSGTEVVEPEVLHTQIEEIPQSKDVELTVPGTEAVELEVPDDKILEPEVPDAKILLNYESFQRNCQNLPINETADYQEASEPEIPINSTELNPEETFGNLDDKIPGDDIGATSVFFEDTPSFMYTSDLDLDSDSKNNSETQELDHTEEPEDKSRVGESSKLEESEVGTISGELSGTSLKRSIFEDDEEEIERKKFISKYQEADFQENGQNVEEIIEKIYIPEIGSVEGNEINVRFQQLLLRDELLSRKLKACRLEKTKKLEEKISKPEVLRKSESRTRFDVLKEGLEQYSKSKSCIWRIHTINPEVICIEFYKTALVLGIRIEHGTDEEKISRVRVLPRVDDEDSEVLKMTDRFAVRAIDCEKLLEVYFSYADVPKLIADVTEQVHFAYDFYDDLVKFHRVNLLDLAGDIITATIRTKKMETIIKLIIDISSYPAVTPDDITVVPILGTVREGDVKNLVKNLKPSPKMLTLYLNDVREFLELLAIANSKN